MSVSSPRHPVKHLLLILLVLPLSLLLGACSPSEEIPQIDLSIRVDDQTAATQFKDNHTHNSVLQFGFDLRGSPQEDARQYLPFLDYLSRTTGHSFKLHFTAPHGNIVDELGTGIVQFAAIGASSYLEARERYGAIALVRGVNSQGLAEYQSVLVVRPESAIERVSELRGRRMAFGPPNSTQGHLIPRIILKKHGLTLKDLAAYRYTDSHQACANAVISGKYDACGMQDTMGRSLANKGLVRILYTSDYFPSSGIAANPALPAALVEKVTAALLAFDPQGRHSDGLYHWERTEMANGFTAAMEGDYDSLFYWLVEFGIQPAPKAR